MDKRILALTPLIVVLSVPIASTLLCLLPDARPVLVEKALYYGGADAAFIFRVDDYAVDPQLWDRLPDSLPDSSIVHDNYQEALVGKLTRQYPWLRATLGVVTGCTGGDCSIGWAQLRSLVSRYHWEAASHSRHHRRLPRTPDDYIGSIRDIEDNLTGYRVLTYIMPYGEATPVELAGVVDSGVRVLADTLPSLPIRPLTPPVWDLHVTVKASSSLPWRPWLQLALGTAEVSRGIVVVYTHATSYDWRSQGQLLDALDYIASVLEGRNVWVTTPGEVYSYHRILSSTEIHYRVDGDKIIISVEGEPPSGSWRLPVSILVYTGSHNIDSITVNGSVPAQLPAMTPFSTPRKGYTKLNGYLVVNVAPPARIVVDLDSPAWSLPGWLPRLERTLGYAKLASYTLWAPVIIAAVRVARAGKLRLPPPPQAKPLSYAVIIPARNASETIDDALGSVLLQEHKPAAIIVIDDASTDSTLEAAAGRLERGGAVKSGSEVRDGYIIIAYRLPWGGEALLARAPRQAGKPSNINWALSLLPRDVDAVLILDSDTILEASAARVMASVLAEDPSIGAVGAVVLLDRAFENGRLAHHMAGALRDIGGASMTLGVRMIEFLYKSSTNINGASVMVRRKALDAIGGYPTESLADDALLAWRLSLQGYRVATAWDARAYTRETGTVRGIAWKSLRITAGLIQAWAKILPSALARRNWYLALGSTYNALGGLPLLLSLIYLAGSSLLLAAGALHETLAYRLALLIPDSMPRSLLVTLLSEPLTYFTLLYATTVIEATLLVVGLAQAYKNDKILQSRLRKAARYALVFPIVLWTATTTLLVAPLYLLARRLRGEYHVKW